MGESCSACLTFEFQPENVAPLHPDASLFVRSQWSPNITWHYLVYRIIVAILMTSWVVADLLTESAEWYDHQYLIWFLFATNWSLLLLCIYSVVMSICSTYYYSKSRRNHVKYPSGPLNVGLMIGWIFYNIAANGAFVVSLSYWSFLAASDDTGFLVTPMSRLKHTLNSIYVIIDIMIIAVPIRVFHLIWPLMVGAVYALFNALYFTNHGRGPEGKPYAYYVMDWRNPLMSALTCAAGFILTTLVQGILYGLYRLRLCLYNRVRERIEDDAYEEQCGIFDEEENKGIMKNGRTASYSSTCSAEDHEMH